MSLHSLLVAPIISAYQARLNMIEGRRAQMLGRINELRALVAIDPQNWNAPSWLRSVRLATPWEDSVGVDLVVETDAGLVPIQVKSSEGGAKKHYSKYGDAIGCVVVRIKEILEELRMRIIELIETARARKASTLSGAPPGALDFSKNFLGLLVSQVLGGATVRPF